MKIKKKNPCIQILYLSIVLSFVTAILLLPSDGLSFAQEDDDDGDKDEEEEDEDKLVVKANIDLENIDLENTKFIRVIGFINGEEAKQDIPISTIDKYDDNLDVELKVNEENDIVEASTPDEFFVCGYQVGEGDVSKESIAATPITKFDCNEGDILGNPTEISLFSAGSQVYAKSQEYHQAHVNTINNNANSDTVKIKILAPLADKKITEKLVIAAMIKGQIQSEVIQDVNFNIPQRYSETYNTLNKNIQDYTVNSTNFVNELIASGIENFNKSIELTQRYYNDIVQNNFNYARKIEKSYNRQ